MTLCSRALRLLMPVLALLPVACESGPPAPPPPPASSAAVAEFQLVGREITLRDGATLQLPSNAQVHRALGWLSEAVLRTQVYRLGGAQRLLTVNELDPKGRTCPAILDQEWTRLSRAKQAPGQQPPERRQVTVTEQHTVQGRRVLYSESRPQGRQAAGNGAPQTLILTTMLCEGSSNVTLIYAVDQAGKLGDAPKRDAKELLLQIAASYRPAGK